jgi:hypothetical protein
MSIKKLNRVDAKDAKKERFKRKVIKASEGIEEIFNYSSLTSFPLLTLR